MDQPEYADLDGDERIEVEEVFEQEAWSETLGSSEEQPVGGPAPLSPAEGFESAIDRPRTSLFYRLGLLVVAVTMLALPALYVGMIGAVGYGTYYHATENRDRIFAIGGAVGVGSGRTRGMILLFKGLVYFGPIVVGGATILCFLKPFFARRPPKPEPYGLNRDAEPELYAFIETLCDVVGAPRPKRIELDCDLNAAAGFDRVSGGMSRNNLVLVIGLPLVAALNLRQFAGVLAHELGHFTQGAGMRASLLINSVDGWFARAAFERDSWDDALDDIDEDAFWLIGLLALLAQFGIWCSRLALRVLILFGHGISCFFSRQMERNADAYQCKVAGSDTFENTMVEIETLGRISGAAQDELVMRFISGHPLPDNLPAYFQEQATAFPANLRREIENRVGFAKTGLFDMHPSAAERVHQARRMDEPGVFHLEGPASGLFSRFEVPAKIVTLIHYQQAWGLSVTPAALFSLKQSVKAAVKKSVDARELIDRHLFGIEELMRPIAGQEEIPASDDPPRDIAALQAIPAELEEFRAVTARAAERFRAAGEREKRANRAHAALSFGAPPEPQLEWGSDATLEDALAEIEAARAEMAAARLEAGRTIDGLRRRLFLALSLLKSPAAAEGFVTREELLKSLADSWPSLTTLDEQYGTERQLAWFHDRLGALLAAYAAGFTAPEIALEVSRTAFDAQTAQSGIQQATSGLEHPLVKSKGRLAVKLNLDRDGLEPDQARGIHDRAGDLLTRLDTLYDEALGDLVYIAEEVETFFAPG